MSKKSKAVSPTGNRDRRGRFGPGNPGGPGRPPSAAVMMFRAEFREAVEAGDIRAAARKLIEAAKRGDLNAASELFDRTIGRPAPADLTEDLADLREQIEQLRKEVTDARTT